MPLPTPVLPRMWTTARPAGRPAVAAGRSPRSRRRATTLTSRIVGAARYLRANDPFNPAAYLLLRGFRWGELRANPGAPSIPSCWRLRRRTSG